MGDRVARAKEADAGSTIGNGIVIAPKVAKFRKEFVERLKK
jgi:hypothetical protein